jgi:hypothetical protein
LYTDGAATAARNHARTSGTIDLFGRIRRGWVGTTALLTGRDIITVP